MSSLHLCKDVVCASCQAKWKKKNERNGRKSSRITSTSEESKMGVTREGQKENTPKAGSGPCKTRKDYVVIMTDFYRYTPAYITNLDANIPAFCNDCKREWRCGASRSCG